MPSSVFFNLSPWHLIHALYSRKSLHAARELKQVAQIVECARQCVTASGVREVDAVYLTGGSSALAPLGAALQAAFSSASIVRGDRFGSVAAGLATSGWVSWQESALLSTS